MVDLSPDAGAQDVRRPGHEVLKCVAGHAKLAFDQCDRHVVEAASAKRLWHVCCVEAGVDGAALDVRSHLVGNGSEPFNLLLVREQLFGREGTRGLDDELVLGCQLEVHLAPI